MKSKKINTPESYFTNFENEIKLKIKKNKTRKKILFTSIILFLGIGLGLLYHNKNNPLYIENKENFYVVNYLIEEAEINENLIIDIMIQNKNENINDENQSIYLLENLDIEELENLIIETI